MKRLALLLILFAVPAQAWTRKPLFQVVPGSPFTGGGGGGTGLAFPLQAPNGTYLIPSYGFASGNAGIFRDTSFTYLQGEDAVGTDQAGKSIQLSPGKGTGTGVSGGFFISVAPPSASTGSSINLLQNIFNAGVSGNLVLGGINIVGTPVASSFTGTNTSANNVAGGNVALEGGAAGAGNANGGDVILQGGIPFGSGVRGSVSLGGGTTGTGVKLDRTITAAGTTGARTIDKMAGTVNFAAAATSIVVTDALVNTSSIIFTTMRTADTTCTFVKSVVPGAGSFTITVNVGCAAETSVGFWVTN